VKNTFLISNKDNSTYKTQNS